jgi:hypothetical protein
VVVDQEGTYRVLRSEEAADGEPPLDHEDRLVGLHPDPLGRVGEVPVGVEAGVIGVDDFYEGATRATTWGLRNIGHVASLA